MLWYHFLIALLACFLITCAEIFFEYSRRCFIVFKSFHFLHWFLLNLFVAAIIVFANIKLNIVNDSDPYTMAIFIGISGFLLLNTKMKLENSNFVSSFKSFMSQQKSKILTDLNTYIKEIYPRNLALSVADKFMYEKGKIDKYIRHIKMVIKVESKGDVAQETRYMREVDDIVQIDYFEDREKVFFLTYKLFEIDSSFWTKRDVFKKFCQKKSPEQLLEE